MKLKYTVQENLYSQLCCLQRLIHLFSMLRGALPPDWHVFMFMAVGRVRHTHTVKHHVDKDGKDSSWVWLGWLLALFTATGETAGRDGAPSFLLLLLKHIHKSTHDPGLRHTTQSLDRVVQGRTCINWRDDHTTIMDIVRPFLPKHSGYQSYDRDNNQSTSTQERWTRR